VTGLGSPRVGVRALAAPVTSGTFAAACGVGLLATSGWLITRASERPPIFALSIAIGAVQAFALGRGVARYLQRLAVHRLALGVLGDQRVALFDALEPKVPGGIPSGGAVLSAFVADADAVAEGLARRTTASVDVVASVALGTALAAFFAPVAAAILVSGCLVLAAVSWLGARVARRGTLAEAELHGAVAGVVMDAIRAAPELVAFGRADLVAERLEGVRAHASAAARRRAAGAAWARASALLAGGATLVAVVLTGLAAHSAGRLSGVGLAVLVFGSLAVLDQLQALPVVLADLDAASRSAASLRSLSSIEDPAPELPAPCPVQPDERRGASLERASVVFPGTVAFDGLSLDAPMGRRVALVGPSGSGKTTALHALLHFVTCRRGRATLGGVDVSVLGRAEVARSVSWVPDETHVFAASLAENLRVARPDATDEECIAVLVRAGLARFLASLADGLATPLRAGGRACSAGERQRIGLARALLAETPVLLLDEPTAHLDPDASHTVLPELLDASGGRAVVVVSHDPSIETRVDRVVRLRARR